uniref:DUF6533 domain-containing protein n=1 Tax=Mycena chlorophos TaxID=658473 RepID=A0ABQ0KVD0_MYCCL|nr:predicted protein [Mycena chlorophos]
MDVDDQDIDSVSVQQQIYIYYYINAAAFTLLFYDYLLTLKWEVSRYWPHPSRPTLTSPTILFFANRYGTLLGNIPIVLLDVWLSPATERKAQVCSGLEDYHQYFIIVIQLLVGLMLVLRTYALYERSRYVLASMIFCVLAVIAIGVWGTLHSSSLPAQDKGSNIPLRMGCAYGIKKKETIGYIAAWSGMGAFDVLIFVLTLYRTLTATLSSSRRRFSLTGMNLLAVLMRDGILYFGVIVLCNVGNILTFAIGSDYTRGILNTFTNIISSIMISRLMLNIRDPAVSLQFRSGLNSDEIPDRIDRGGPTVSDYTTGISAQWGVGVFSSVLDEGHV